MDCGLPVVAIICSSLPELVDHGKVGFLCTRGDADPFADRRNELAESRALCNQMGGYNHIRLDDATAESGLLTRLQQAMEEDTRTCIVSAAVVSGDFETESSIWYNHYLGVLTRQPTLLSFAYASGCCLLVGKAALQDDHLYDLDLFMYCEDACLCWRLQRKQQIFRVAGDARIHHVAGASS